MEVKSVGKTGNLTPTPSRPPHPNNFEFCTSWVK